MRAQSYTFLLIPGLHPYTRIVPRFEVTTLHSTTDLWLRRVSCNGDDGPGPDEERCDENRLIFVLRGRFVFNDYPTRAVINPRRALALLEGDAYTIEHPHGDGDICLSIGGTRLRPLVEAARRVPAVSVPGYLGIQNLAQRFARRSPLDGLAIEEAVCRALAPQDERMQAAGRDRVVADTIVYLIDLRFDEDLTLSRLASAAGVSVFHACRAFRRVMRTSIHQYRQAVRLWHALALLRETSWPLARVAVEVGFANQGHLGNVFRRRFGVTPARARTLPIDRSGFRRSPGGLDLNDRF